MLTVFVNVFGYFFIQLSTAKKQLFVTRFVILETGRTRGLCFEEFEVHLFEYSIIELLN